MKPVPTFTSTDGKRRVKLVSYEGDRHFTWLVTDPRGTHEAHNTVISRFPARTIQQTRTINGKQVDITLIAPVTLAQFRQAGVSQRDLEAWGLVVPPVKNEVKAA